MSPSKTDGKSGRFYRDETWGRSPLTLTEDWPSVTHVLSVLSKPALVNWAANQERTSCIETAADLYADLVKLPVPLERPSYVAQFNNRLTSTKAHQRTTAQATDIGGQAHKLIEWSIRKALGEVVGPEPKVRDEALWAFMAFQDWAREHAVKPIFLEQAVWHPRLGYAGTLDLYAEVDGRLALVDFKTSKAIYGEHHIQCAAYQDALIELGHGRPEVGFVLRVPKNVEDPKFEVQESPSRLKLMPVFRALLRVWKWWHAEDQRSLAAWKAAKDAAAQPAVSA